MLTIKVLHIAAVVFWYAGLLYLPRLFVYHTEAEDDISRQRFCLMESRLYWRIMLPSMVVTLICGLLLLPNYQGGWIGIKLLLVLLLVLYHIYCGVVVRRFVIGGTPHSGRFFRIFNEIPPLVLLVVVWLVVVKPF
jgi:putative membrane protein